jgi:hypothetical protein
LKLIREKVGKFYSLKIQRRKDDEELDISSEAVGIKIAGAASRGFWSPAKS